MGPRAALRNRWDRVLARALAGRHAALVAELDAVVAARVDAAVAGIVAELRAVETRDRRDTVAAADREAVAATARFVQREMVEAVHLDHPHDTLRHALASAPTGGLALEFGVATGTTLRIIAHARGGRDVHGFDSFDGLPLTWRTGFRSGAFGCAAPEVPGAELVVGLFEETLPDFLARHPGPVDLLHLDADLYSSTACVLKHVGPRLRSGSVVVFDEYFNYPGWERHEALAWAEYTAAHGIEFEYTAYTYDNEQVVVRLLTGGDSAQL